jgi:hypothetical protein
MQANNDQVDEQRPFNINIGGFIAMSTLMFLMFVFAIIGGSIGVDYWNTQHVDKTLYIMGILTLVITLVGGMPGLYHPLAGSGVILGFILGVIVWIFTNKSKNNRPNQ